MPVAKHHTATRGQLLAESGLFDGEWYAARHGDVALSGKSAWEHFLAFGWDLGRSPGPDFDARAYFLCYGDVADSGMDALTHYLRYGVSEGRAPNRLAQDPTLRARAISDVLRARLNIVGQRSALQPLEHLANEGSGDEAAFAGRDLALWHLQQWRHKGVPASAKAAAQWAQAADAAAHDPVLRAHLLNVLLVARAAASAPPPSEAQIATWAEEGRITPDTWLALTGFEPTAEGRLARINQALAAHDLTPLTLRPQAAATPYDQLDAVEAPEPVEGPLVTVLIAAYKAEDTLPTALRAMARQSWRNLEILVIDDASPDRTAEIAEATARSDPRIRVIRQPRNGGAYVARNFGLAAARGEYVTIHDADDWCHPERIARQMAILTETEEAMACTSIHVRIQSDLTLTRLSPEAHFMTDNTASLLFRREPVVNALGGWDEVRVAADNEFIRRIARVFGAGSVVSAQTGPLALLRDWAGSAVGGGPLAIDGYITGARLAYLDAQEHHHHNAPISALHYASNERPFPAPRILREGATKPHVLSVLIAADLRRADHVVEICMQLAKAANGPVGLVPLVRPIPPDGCDQPLRMCLALRAALDGETLLQVCPGESAIAPMLILPDPEALAELPDPLPTLQAERVRLLADHPPVSTLPATGRRVTRYEPATCEAVARQITAGPLEWWALTSAIRTELKHAGATNVSRKLLQVAEPGRVLR